jgi:hypothetical protein
MTERYEGMWDFAGSCAPPEHGARLTSQETFTLGCFQWVRIARGKKLKKGKVQYRVKGNASDPAPAYVAARAYCAKKNAMLEADK